MAANLSADGLRQIAARLEMMVKRGKWDAAADLVDQLQTEIDKCLVQIPQLLNKKRERSQAT